MATMTSLHVPFEGWTVDDLPEDVDFSYELVDGALLVTPPADPRHDRVAMRLSRLLLPLGRQWDVLVDSGIFFDERNYREPDLIVCRRAAIDRGRVSASDVLLAVEVLSPGSVASDRIAKPAQYAAAGIPHFWRIEPAQPVLVTYALAGDVYRETGRFDDEVTVEKPVPLRFRLADLVA